MNITYTRLGAQLLDLVIYYILSSIPFFLTIIFITFVAQAGKLADSNPILSLLMCLGGISMPLTYIGLNYMHLKQGATLGYKLTKLKLVNEDGKAMTDKQALARSILRIIFVPLMFTWLVALLHGLILFQSEGKRDLIDNMLHTQAVKA